MALSVASEHVTLPRCVHASPLLTAFPFVPPILD